MISRKVILCAIVILIVLVPLWPAFDKVGMPMDEGSLLVYPELVLKGQVPYRDFETFYGPANLLVLSATYAVFSPGIFVERSVGLAYRVLILLGLFLIAQRWNTVLAAGCTFLAGVLFLPCLLQAHAWMGGVMCGLWSIWLLAWSESKWHLFAAGILAGAAVMFRQDLGPAVIMSAVPLLLLARFVPRRFYVGGVLVALLPLVWLTITAGPREIINNLFLFPVIHANPGRHLPIFAAEKSVICLFIIHLISAITNILVGAVAVLRNRSEMRSRLLLSLGLFGLGLTHQAFQRLDLLHVLYAVAFSASILPLSIFNLLQRNERNIVRPTKDAALAVAAAVILLGAVVPEVAFYFRSELTAAVAGESPESVFVTAHGRSFPVSTEEEAIALTRMLKRLDTMTSAGERLFVGPADLRRTNLNDTFIYHLMPDLRPASYFLEMNPGSANRPNSRLASDVASADWLVLDRVLDFTSEQNESAKFASELPMQVVKEHFELCGRFGAWQVYRRKTLASI